MAKSSRASKGSSGRPPVSQRIKDIVRINKEKWAAMSSAERARASSLARKKALAKATKKIAEKEARAARVAAARAKATAKKEARHAKAAARAAKKATKAAAVRKPVSQRIKDIVRINKEKWAGVSSVERARLSAELARRQAVAADWREIKKRVATKKARVAKAAALKAARAPSTLTERVEGLKIRPTKQFVNMVKTTDKYAAFRAPKWIRFLYLVRRSSPGDNWFAIANEMRRTIENSGREAGYQLRLATSVLTKKIAGRRAPDYTAVENLVGGPQSMQALLDNKRYAVGAVRTLVRAYRTALIKVRAIKPAYQNLFLDAWRMATTHSPSLAYLLWRIKTTKKPRVGAPNSAATKRNVIYALRTFAALPFSESAAMENLSLELVRKYFTKSAITQAKARSGVKKLAKAVKKMGERVKEEFKNPFGKASSLIKWVVAQARLLGSRMGTERIIPADVVGENIEDYTSGIVAGRRLRREAVNAKIAANKAKRAAKQASSSATEAKRTASRNRSRSPGRTASPGRPGSAARLAKAANEVKHASQVVSQAASVVSSSRGGKTASAERKASAALNSAAKSASRAASAVVAAASSSGRSSERKVSQARKAASKASKKAASAVVAVSSSPRRSARQAARRSSARTIPRRATASRRVTAGGGVRKSARIARRTGQ